MSAPMRRLVRRLGEPGTPRRATGAFAARLAGSVVGVAGITLIGAGTFGSPASAFASDGHHSQTTASFTCASDQECVQPSAVPSAGDNGGCTAIAGLLKVDSLDSSDSYWHFVVPDAEGFELNGTGFDASFNGANTEFTVTYVQQGKDGGYKAVVVEADGGTTLTWAWAPESGIMDETAEAEGTGAEDSNGNGDLVLSSTCAGGSTSSSSTTSSTSSTRSTTSSTQSTTSSTPTTTSSSSQTTTSNDTTSSSSTSSTSSSSSTSSTPTTTSSDTVSTQSTSSESSSALTTVVTDPSSSTSTSSTVSSSSSSASDPSTGVLGASTTTPSTGADIEFGLGLTLLLGGAGVMIGATRIRRSKRR